MRLRRRIYPQVGETGMLVAQTIRDKLLMSKVTSQVQWKSTPAPQATAGIEPGKDRGKSCQAKNCLFVLTQVTQL